MDRLKVHVSIDTLQTEGTWEFRRVLQTVVRLPRRPQGRTEQGRGQGCGRGSKNPHPQVLHMKGNGQEDWAEESILTDNKASSLPFSKVSEVLVPCDQLSSANTVLVQCSGSPKQMILLLTYQKVNSSLNIHPNTCAIHLTSSLRRDAILPCFSTRKARRVQ